MSESRRLLERNKKLFQWANAIVSDDRWEMLMMHAKSHMMSTKPLTPEAQTAISNYLDCLKELTQPEETPGKLPSFGLRHDLDVPTRTQQGLTPDPESE